MAKSNVFLLLQAPQWGGHSGAERIRWESHNKWCYPYRPECKLLFRPVVSSATAARSMATVRVQVLHSQLWPSTLNCIFVLNWTVPAKVAVGDILGWVSLKMFWWNAHFGTLVLLASSRKIHFVLETLSTTKQNHIQKSHFANGQFTQLFNKPLQTESVWAVQSWVAFLLFDKCICQRKKFKNN